MSTGSVGTRAQRGKTSSDLWIVPEKVESQTQLTEEEIDESLWKEERMLIKC